MKGNRLIVVLFCVCFSKAIIGQFTSVNLLKSHVQFSPHVEDRYGLSTPQMDHTIAFDSIADLSGAQVVISVKSLTKGSTGKVNFTIKQGFEKQLGEFRFIREDTREPIRRNRINDSTISLNLPASLDDYYVYCLRNRQLIAALKIVVFERLTERVIVVPLVSTGINVDSLEKGVNKIFNQSCVNLKLQLKPLFEFEDMQGIDRMKNPISTDQYTDQMHEIRDAYFKRFPKADRKAFYVFITPPFVNGKKSGFCVQSKSLSFIPFDSSSVFIKHFAAVLAQSIGYLKMKNEVNENLLSYDSGLWLNHLQWSALRHNSHTFSRYDNYEDIQTNNGSVAYYFWQEDRQGNILLDKDGLLASIKRPFKKNEVSYHLYINEFMYQPRILLWGRKLTLWHFFVAGFIFLIFIFLRIFLLKVILRNFRKPSFWRIASGWMVLFLTVYGSYLAFQKIDAGFQQFEVRRGLLRELGRKSISQAMRAILHNERMDYRPESTLTSEILTNIDGRWFIKMRSRVLYFDCEVDEKNKLLSIRFTHDSDRLSLDDPFTELDVRSHYMVFNFRNAKNELLYQKLFNHLGSDLGYKIKTKNPVNRILLFVNGYRPTSMGHSFEENFEDLRQNGLEYPNSTNLIYDFDRYDYWRPWNAIDSLFIDRINPNKTYYADGHFSVSTSNHGSLLNFSALAAVYPKRCKNRKRHSCYQTVMTSSGWFGSKNRKTKELLRLSPNYEGFKMRYTNGRVAGRSLLQELNEIPNKSENDTIYIVAHSMGYAYALGMIKELRGRVSFGGFYIIAPENASCGSVRMNEWKEVWQYGSNFNPGKEDAPCLQDGVAPQVAVTGLTAEKRCYIPSSLYTSKGFFDAHFIGYYSWIFNIPQGRKGAVQQR